MRALFQKGREVCCTDVQTVYYDDDYVGSGSGVKGFVFIDKSDDNFQIFIPEKLYSVQLEKIRHGFFNGIFDMTGEEFYSVDVSDEEDWKSFCDKLHNGEPG